MSFFILVHFLNGSPRSPGQPLLLLAVHLVRHPERTTGHRPRPGVSDLALALDRLNARLAVETIDLVREAQEEGGRRGEISIGTRGRRMIGGIIEGTVGEMKGETVVETTGGILIGTGTVEGRRRGRGIETADVIKCCI